MPGDSLDGELFSDMGFDILDASLHVCAVIQGSATSFPRTVDFIITAARIVVCSGFAI